jgi:hypothetical protein
MGGSRANLALVMNLGLVVVVVGAGSAHRWATVPIPIRASVGTPPPGAQPAA